MNTLSGKIRLNFRSAEPLFLQIASQVEAMVTSGELKVGEQLPTVRELATELRINFNTVARAYRLLDENRLISTQRGRGTYIWEEPEEATVQQLRRHRLEEMTRSYLESVRQLGFSLAETMDVLGEISAEEEGAGVKPESGPPEDHQEDAD